jgi:hypothetical protein
MIMAGTVPGKSGGLKVEAARPVPERSPASPRKLLSSPAISTANLMPIAAGPQPIDFSPVIQMFVLPAAAFVRDRRRP